MPLVSNSGRAVVAACLWMACATGAVAQTPPPFYFVVDGNITNGDQYDSGHLYRFETGTGGGGSTSRPVRFGSVSVATTIGPGALTATFQGEMRPVHASKVCGYYGCGYSLTAGTTPYSTIGVYVRGAPGTRYHFDQADSGQLAASVLETHACASGYGNAQATAFWGGRGDNVRATTEQGPSDYCGRPAPKSGTAAVSLNTTEDGVTTTPTLTYLGQTYSFAYWARTDLTLDIYANQDPDFTATSTGTVNVRISGHIVRPQQQTPTARIAAPTTVMTGAQALLDGSGSYDPDGTLLDYRWEIQNAIGGTDVFGGGPFPYAQLPYIWAVPGSYQVVLTVTDDDGQTASTTTSVTVVAARHDDDGDGVANDVDKCPNTQAGQPVDVNGCAASQRDSDGDGVTDDKDECPGTPSGVPVYQNGCGVLKLQLIDPVPDLLDNQQLTQDSTRLASLGTRVSGVAADGAARVVIRLTGAQPGEGIRFSLATDGQLATVGSSSFSSSVVVSADQQGLAVAVLLAPNDFARVGGADDSSSSRFIDLRVQSTDHPGTADTVAVRIVRPPVVMVHGTWSKSTTWDFFGALRRGGSVFDVETVDYGAVETSGVIPAASFVADLLEDIIERFKLARDVAAVQSDLVAHSLGGLVSRSLSLFGQRTPFENGFVHKLITLDSTHQGTPFASNLYNSGQACHDFFAKQGNPVGNQIRDQQIGSSLLNRLNSAVAAVHIEAHVLIATADANQLNDAEGALATWWVRRQCPTLLPTGKFRDLFQIDNPSGDNDIIVGENSQAAIGSGIAAAIPVTRFPGFIHSVSKISPTGPDVLNRVKANKASPDTVPMVAEVLRLLNAQINRVEFAPIRP